jgi:DOPA 4,5-dioxygenase
MTDTADIRGFHAHVYFDAETRTTAEQLRDAIAQRFGVSVGKMHQGPVGPHKKAMFQVTIATAQFAAIVPWLMVNRRELSVLVHPQTNDDFADHTVLPLWMGEVIPLDIEWMRGVLAERAKNGGAHHDHD